MGMCLAEKQRHTPSQASPLQDQERPRIVIMKNEVLKPMDKSQTLKNRDLVLSEFQFSLSHYILRPNFNAVPASWWAR
jgi:hypothetical protein